ncbi:LuxR C-terminal-related transcriptional regulator [Mycobacterium sp. TY815]|uniref:helix-turn-helix transcriptional regulator n=1 Tax=Mycobacterium sp. TY815 TaxID=3050581 RepID=UPI003531F8DD
MLATMSQHAEMPSLTWGEWGVSELLPTGTVTLLLADVEGSTRLWESQPEQMTAAVAQLSRAVDETVAAFGGVRPVEQGEGDSFVAAFARASDAVGCALALQRAPLAPIRMRIGLHTGEIQLRDEGNYAGPTINRAARIRDLAHGGQTVMSGVTEALVVDRLPEGAWLTELGSYPLRGVPRPERVVQVCHQDLRNEFPPLRVRSVVAAHNLPAQLTSFIGRQAEMAAVRHLVVGNRLVTLTGAGGAGKTRLAVEAVAQLGAQFSDGIWYVDLAPITNPAVVPVTTARTLGLPDQPGLSNVETLVRYFGEKETLLLLDNCEHLLDACGALVVELLASCPRLAVVATSREPLGVPGELSWRVPSLSLVDEAVELFADRACRIRPEFVVTQDDTALVREICERLDGMPLAIELAAARVRALSLKQIRDSLHDRFRLLTGGARTAVRRQQTLRASVDWSYALLTETERALLRRLSVFASGFDLDAAGAVGASNEVESYQLMDQLGLLVDKSLVVADDVHGGMRYRLLETVRQYAQEKLGESGEADQVRTRHRDHYANTAAEMYAQGQPAEDRLLRWAQIEIDNLRAAFTWSRENSDLDTALRLILSLGPLWVRGSRVAEASAALDAILLEYGQAHISPAVWAAAESYRCSLATFGGLPVDIARAREALAVARELDDRSLIVRALNACGMSSMFSPEVAQAYLAEAYELAAAGGERWVQCQLATSRAAVECVAGEPVAALTAAEAALEIADSCGDWFYSLDIRTWLGLALMMRGRLDEAERVAGRLAPEAEMAGDSIHTLFGHITHGLVLVAQGRSAAARAVAESAVVIAQGLGGVGADTAYGILAQAALADGDSAGAMRWCESAWRYTYPQREVFTKSIVPMAEAALASGDLVMARSWADDAVASVPGWHRFVALTVRAFVALAQGDRELSERDAHDALAAASQKGAFLRVPDTFECVARLAADDGDHPYAVRLFGAADGIRQRLGHARYPMYQAGYQLATERLRETLGQNDFDAMWAEGAALSIEEAIAYAQRGRGERKRPATGWGALTPMEHDVVRLVAEGLGNRDIGARLFISPRTVQSHLTHVYAKLGLESRVQLAQEAGRRT